MVHTVVIFVAVPLYPRSLVGRLVLVDRLLKSLADLELPVEAEAETIINSFVNLVVLHRLLVDKPVPVVELSSVLPFDCIRYRLLTGPLLIVLHQRLLRLQPEHFFAYLVELFDLPFVAAWRQ